mgnify:FL=1
MKFEKTAEMIFELCSRRVKNRVEESGKSLEVLYPENPKLISLIQNNRRDKYHNRYLLTAAGIDVLVPALGFHSIEELLWGTKQEQDSYFLRFFLCAMGELSNPTDPNSHLDQVMCAYAPYAKYYTFYHLIKEKNIPAIEFAMNQEIIEWELEPTSKEAISMLYGECYEDLINCFHRFTSKTDSYKKLPEKIGQLVLDVNGFMPILEKYYNMGNALGYRVRELILSDLQYAPNLIKGTAPKGIEPALIRATTQYIIEIEEIHKKQIWG